MNFKDIVIKGMYENDAFSKWLGIEIIEVTEGACTIQMTVRKEMTNGFGIAHGGITYALADSAFAFASNSRGKHAVSIETSIAHIKAVKVGNILTAVSKELNRSNKLGHYDTVVTNENNDIVALFKGTVYIKDVDWIE